VFEHPSADRFFVVFLGFFVNQIMGQYLKTGHQHFLPSPSNLSSGILLPFYTV
jgi:hypothetical protein